MKVKPILDMTFHECTLDCLTKKYLKISLSQNQNKSMSNVL